MQIYQLTLALFFIKTETKLCYLAFYFRILTLH